MTDWDQDFEAGCRERVLLACDGARPAREREAAWKALLVRIAPFLERWAARAPVLRRSGLASEDDARAVLVAVLARLSARDFANLRAFLGAQPPTDDDAEIVESIVRLARADDEATEREPGAPDGQPLRGWLFRLVRYCAADHVRERLGWSEGRGDGALTRRDVGTNADRLDGAAEPASRPPITDLVTCRRVLSEIRTHMDSFPADMRAALDRWLGDASFDEIARELGLEGEAEARGLVRAGLARLRARFRDEWPDLQLPA
jgi:DNA-directed RNA polymerase specialized sigma24 family protein